jgi:hypothetical protein
MAHNRVEGDVFPMTHEFLSLMLGIRSAGITVAAGSLQKIARRAYDRLLGPPVEAKGSYWR